MSKTKSDEKNDDSNESLLKHGLETLKPLQEAIVARFSNPIFFGFIISWALFNWDRLAILFFSKQSIITRIDTVKKMPSNIILYWDIPNATTIWLPLASTLTLILLSPFINNLIDKILVSARTLKQSHDEYLVRHSYKQKELSVIARVNYEEATETQRLRLKAEQESLKAEAFTSQSNISDLKNTLSSLSESIANSKTINETLKEENSELAKRIEGLKKESDEYNASISLMRTNLYELNNEKSQINSQHLEAIKKLKNEILTLKHNKDETYNHLLGILSLVDNQGNITTEQEISIINPAKLWVQNTSWAKEQSSKLIEHP
ncbi:hypothetical protein [Enterobacter sp. 302C9]|uniref:hypothetical protein n=1 Tax=Enterobacter sp. 302C9 TaxID=3077766 RepID=UPI002A83653F|nr:hypothetical protein [Enterobacter sp. 302C9]